MDRSHIRPITFGVVGLLVVSAATAAAASPGDPWRLGMANTINAATSLSGAVATRLVGINNTSTEAGARALSLVSRTSTSTLFAENQGTGPALQLRVTAGRPPLTVNSTAGKATNLDADRLDGLHANQLARGSGEFATEEIVDFNVCSYSTILTKTATAPTSGVLLVNATVAWKFDMGSTAGSTATLYTRFALNGAPLMPEVGSSTTAEVSEANNTVIVAAPVSAGSHTVNLQVKECGTGMAHIWNEAITTLFVPFNNSGSSGTGILGLPGASGDGR